MATSGLSSRLSSNLTSGSSTSSTSSALARRRAERAEREKERERERQSFLQSRQERQERTTLSSRRQHDAYSGTSVEGGVGYGDMLHGSASLNQAESGNSEVSLFYCSSMNT